MNKKRSLRTGGLLTWGKIAETFITAAEDIETTMFQFESPTEHQSGSIPGNPTREVELANQTNSGPIHLESSSDTDCPGQTNSRT